jgi:hypothetical protein
LSRNDAKMTSKTTDERHKSSGCETQCSSRRVKAKRENSHELVSEVARSGCPRQRAVGGGRCARAPASGAPSARPRMLQRQQSMGASNREAARAWRDFLPERREKAKSMTRPQLRRDQRASLNASGDEHKGVARSGRGSRD